jgi:hypothetical protein
MMSRSRARWQEFEYLKNENSPSSIWISGFLKTKYNIPYLLQKASIFSLDRNKKFAFTWPGAKSVF